MYQSPIKFNIQRSVTEFGEKLDAAVFKAVMQVGISVDKEELLKALEYDRDQYNQGYQAAIQDKDLVEVVRCKNCSWYDERADYCTFWDSVRHPEHFCGEGERKDND
jgi:hypothetical protein